MTWQTVCLKVGENNQTDPAIQRASQLLGQGDLVAFPTETVYGLGGNALSLSAVNKIFAAKRRPTDNPLIVHIAHQNLIPQFCHKLPTLVKALAEAFWPGPLTLVVPANSQTQETVSRGLNSVALRVPDHPIALALLRSTGLGIAAPSANLSGRPSPTQASHVLHDMADRIPLILDGGPCNLGIESTVLDLSQGPPTILRPGSIRVHQLERVLGFAPALSDRDERLKHSPGTRYPHYSPSVPVILIFPEVGNASFLELLRTNGAQGKVAYMGKRSVPEHTLFKRADPDTLPSMLYATLREWDREEIGCIIVEGDHHETHSAVMDRIGKAASYLLASNSEVSAFLQAGGLAG